MPRLIIAARRIILSLAAAAMLCLYPAPGALAASDGSDGSASDSGTMATTVTDQPTPTDTDNTSSPSNNPTSTDSSPSSSDQSSTNNKSSGSNSTTPAVSSQPAKPGTPPTGPSKPTGADSGTYTYNPATGLWENQYYTWNPATQQTTPKTPPTYSYNPATGMWDTPQYVYSPASGTYVPNVVSVNQLPANASITTSGPNSTNAVTGGGTGDSTFDNFYNPTISNLLTSNAASGDALVMDNTSAGGALTGNAQDLANIINLLQSTADLTGANFTSFVSNITGNMQGDLVIDPSLLQSGANPSQIADNTVINAVTNGAINNNIALDAGSGDANVSGNTSAGNATSGDATAVADVINLINSAIAARQSFLGVVNIYGNLDGNIVVPQSFIDSLLASNTPSDSTTSPSSQTNNLVANLNGNESVSNNVNTIATSGTASVSGNTSGGSAASGSTNTDVTIFNLTGRNVVASNSLLVFVNVLGKWVGLIMNAPAGSTAAALGGGVTENTTGNNNTSINATDNEQINNSISVKAHSGNASETNNTLAGNATSGNASASANLLNMMNSDFSLSNWFGVLFINVFGSWLGSFGVQTPPANPTAASSSGGTNAVQAVKVFQFVPHGTDSYSLASVNIPGLTSGSASGGGNSSTDNPAQRLVSLINSTQSTPPANSHSSGTTAQAPTGYHVNWIFASIGFVGLALLVGDRFRSFSQRRRSLQRTTRLVMLSQLHRPPTRAPKHG